MIPLFPEFKKIELSDKQEIDAHTADYPPYSDFEFGSLWSWDVKEEMKVSCLNGNLVVCFTDYTTGEPFLTFLGSKKVAETADALLSYSSTARLHLVPEVAVTDLGPERYLIEEERDHFDYVCEVEQHIDYAGNSLKSHRKLLRAFRESVPDYEAVTLDMESPEARRDVAEVYRSWDEGKGFLMTSEAFAYERFLAADASIAYTAVGIRVKGKLIAFHIASLPPGTCANALFGKADTTYRGVYAALDHVVAKDLLSRGYTHMNIQQDLGLENLRNAKLALHPAYLLKKYSVCWKSGHTTA